jgi:hypothetical protein
MTASSPEGEPVMTAPARSRAVLSNEDFRLLQEAVRFWIQNNEESQLTSKYANLYHRLGTAAGHT